MKNYSLFDLSRGLCLFCLIYIWGYSSVGRAPALQAGGQEFESPYLHLPAQQSRMHLEN